MIAISLIIAVLASGLSAIAVGALVSSYITPRNNLSELCFELWFELFAIVISGSIATYSTTITDIFGLTAVPASMLTSGIMSVGALFGCVWIGSSLVRIATHPDDFGGTLKRLGSGAVIGAAAVFGAPLALEAGAPPADVPMLPIELTEWSTGIGLLIYVVYVIVLALWPVIERRERVLVTDDEGVEPSETSFDLPAFVPGGNIPRYLPTRASELTASIEQAIAIALSRESLLTPEAAFTARETQRRYLPDTLKAWQSVPNVANVADRKRIDDTLITQLQEMALAAESLAASTVHRAEDDLLANGHFIHERLAPASIEPAPPHAGEE